MKRPAVENHVLHQVEAPLPDLVNHRPLLHLDRVLAGAHVDGIRRRGGRRRPLSVLEREDLLPSSGEPGRKRDLRGPHAAIVPGLQSVHLHGTRFAAAVQHSRRAARGELAGLKAHRYGARKIPPGKPIPFGNPDLFAHSGHLDISAIAFRVPSRKDVTIRAIYFRDRTLLQLEFHPL